MKISTGELTAMVQGTLEGSPDILLHTASKIEEAREGSICFFANPKYENYIYTTSASAILVSEEFKLKQPINAALIRVKDVYQTVATLLAAFENKTKLSSKIDPLSSVNSDTEIDSQVSIGAFSVIHKGVKIAKNVIIHSQVFIDEDVVIGEGSILLPGVRVHRNCVIGKNCFLNYNVVIGSEGFGFAPTEDGTYKKIAQIGNVILEDNVEIGANTCIDRGSMGSTIIGQGSKLDNLIQIAHNVQIGKNTVIAAQSGVAGSTKIGNNCQIGGQVGIVGHITIADGARIQAQSGIASNVPEPNSKLYGSPAIEYGNYLRSYAEFKKLADLVKEVRRIGKEIK
ncbi:MAG: UDP-3-O-(3-hydroxymyristoyl)glucosamine N-acyltransferase [Saprospiraceae bacterium]|nr:UDP-3-O-(3-hydroxymyristoyl)glucosamine N-acyltransferase [Saprospiraceae bacterium]